MSSVSFIITIYNKERYLKQVIEAIKSQIGDFEKEYIFIDDGSSDNSLRLIKEYTNNWPNITIITQENFGPSRAVNRGISIARCEFIKFVDGDDVLLPDATLSLLNKAIEYHCDIVYGKRSHFYEVGAKLSHINSKENAKITIIKDPLKEVLRGKIRGISSFAGTTGLIKANLLKTTLGADERIFIQDFSMALRSSFKASICYLAKEVAILASKSFKEDHLSSNIAQESHDSLLALYYFIQDHQVEQYRRQIYQRAAKIIWKYKLKSSPFNKYLFYYLFSKVSLTPSLTKIISFIEKSLQEFENIPKTNVKTNLFLSGERPEWIKKYMRTRLHKKNKESIFIRQGYSKIRRNI